MLWFNADDPMYSHPKPRKAGLEAMGLLLVCGTYCTDYLTDSLVPAWYVESWPRGKQLAQKLIKAGFCTAAEEDYRFLFWDEYQRTKKQSRRTRRRRGNEKAAWRQNRNGTAEER